MIPLRRTSLMLKVLRNDVAVLIVWILVGDASLLRRGLFLTWLSLVIHLWSEQFWTIQKQTAGPKIMENTFRSNCVSVSMKILGIVISLIQKRDWAESATMCAIQADRTLTKISYSVMVILYKYEIPVGLPTWLSTPIEHCHALGWQCSRGVD